MTFNQRNAISNPSPGLIIWCSNCDSSGQVQVFNGFKWTNLVGGSAALPVVTNLPSVTIGSQIWSSKNLDVARYRNGDPIPQVKDSAQWVNLTTGAWCWYNNDSATYASTYGKLYNWYAVNDPRGLAPLGWRIPTDSDWNKLTKFVDPAADTLICFTCISYFGGGPLKEAGTSHWLSPNTGATNSSGFTGLPGGNRYRGSFIELGLFGFWWSDGGPDNSFIWIRQLRWGQSDFIRTYLGESSKNIGYSVRVVRD